MRTHENTQLVVVLEADEVAELYHHLNAHQQAPTTEALKDLYATLQQFVNPRIGG